MSSKFQAGQVYRATKFASRTPIGHILLCTANYSGNSFSYITTCHFINLITMEKISLPESHAILFISPKSAS